MARGRGEISIRLLDAAGQLLGLAKAQAMRPPPPAPMDALLRYWAQLPGDEAVPRKADADPVDLVRILPDVFLCERAAPSRTPAATVRFGVHGTQVAETLGRDLTNKTLDEVLDDMRARAVRRPIDLCLDDRAPVRQRLNSVFPGREWVRVDRLVVPLADARGVCRFALGVLCRLPVDDETKLDPGA